MQLTAQTIVVRWIHFWQIATSFLLLILFCSTSFSAKAQNYLDYYHRIATAESLVVSGSYRKAVEEYDRAFSQFSYNNPTDCYVAAQVAAYLRDTFRCKHFLQAGVSFGLPFQTIGNNPHLTSYLSSENAFSLTKATLDSCWNVYQKRIDHDARAAAIDLIKRDQYKIHNTSGTIYEKDGNTLKAANRPFWDSLLNEVILLTRTYGFPAQKIIGTQNGDDGLFVVAPGSVFVFPIFIHHGNAWSQIGDLLWHELENGNITPQMYGGIADESNGHRDYEHQTYLAIRSCLSSAYSSKCKRRINGRLEELDAARHKIGLCSYEVMVQKELSSQAYQKWRKEQPYISNPVFDFPVGLNFMGIQSQ